MAKILLDPYKIAKDEKHLNNLDERLRISKMILSRSPEKGGLPFIYAFTAIKPNILNNEITKIKLGKNSKGEEVFVYTAATDGKSYFWGEKFLEKHSPEEIAIVSGHETYHICLQHCNIHRKAGKNNHIWNIAVDYVVNGMIEHDFRKSGRIPDYEFKNQQHPLWKGNLGRSLSFKRLLASLDKQAKQAKQVDNCEQTIEEEDVQYDKLYRYADYSLYGKSAEDIYNEIMAHAPNNFNQNYIFIQGSGGDGDGFAIITDIHMENDTSRAKLLQEILDAATQAKQMAGKVPGGIEDALGLLSEPKLTWQDIVRHALQSNRQDKGMKNDWTRMRRRAIGMGLYIPRKKDQYVEWLCMLDTSGSMSQEDISYGISQLKVLDGRAKGTVVPCDAEVYWDKATEISNVGDLQRVKVHGKGGTIFNDWFDNYKNHFTKKTDVMIIITDGEIWELEKLKKPDCDVVWVITRDNDFKPPFGRAVALRGKFI
jgi:predicted metal-dependent peptidase